MKERVTDNETVPTKNPRSIAVAVLFLLALVFAGKRGQ